MPAVRNALVIGSGISALCAAIALRRAGIDTSLAHTAVDSVPPIAVILPDNAIRSLVSLGLAPGCLSAGFSFDRVVCHDPLGNALNSAYQMRMAAAARPREMAIAYSALLHILEDTARGYDVGVDRARVLDRIEAGEEATRVWFSDGRDDEYDLLIGADGVFSRTRASVFGTRPSPRFTGQGLWSTTVPRPATLAQPILVRGVSGGTAGFIPVDARSGCLFLLQSERTGAIAALGTATAELRERLAALGGTLALLRQQIADAPPATYQPLYSFFMPAPWHRGRVLLIGDAAHCTLPHLAQGAALAMEDSVTLGELFARTEPVHVLLEEFMARRYDRCRLVYEASVQLSEWELNPSPEADIQTLRARVATLLSQPG